jgi:type II secretory pathway component PulM
MKWLRARSRRERQSLAVGALLTLLAVGYARVARPLVLHALTVRESLERERGLEARERALLAGSVAHTQRLALAEQALDLARERIFVAGDTLAATAALARYVRDLARETGVAVQGTDAEPVGAGPGALTAVRIRLRVSGDLQSLLELIDGIRRGTRLVRISAFGITPEHSIPAWESPEQESLVLAADLEAWALLEEAPE